MSEGPEQAESREAGDARREPTFDEQAALARPGFVRELWDFLRHNKKWWLTPVVVVLLLVGVLVVLSTTAAAPFIYTLF